MTRREGSEISREDPKNLTDRRSGEAGPEAVCAWTARTLLQIEV